LLQRGRSRSGKGRLAPPIPVTPENCRPRRSPTPRVMQHPGQSHKLSPTQAYALLCGHMPLISFIDVTHITFMCRGSISACPSRRACDIDVNDNLINPFAKCGEYATDISCASRVRMSVPRRGCHSAYGSEYANSRDAIRCQYRMARESEPTLPDNRGA
jgi:hypothetical protein